MTLRSYMRVLSAAIALLFVAVGCKDSDEEIPPPSEKYTFDIAVSDIRVADAVVTVTPSDALATYIALSSKRPISINWDPTRLIWTTISII